MAPIKFFNQGFKLVVLNIKFDLLHKRLDYLFDFSWSAAQAGKEKPHPKIFIDVMEKTALKPHNIIHIGDDPLSDIQGAHNAGIVSIWLNREKQTWPKDITPAKYEIDTLHKLNDILMQL